MIKRIFVFRSLSQNNSCQLIVLMGFILVMSVVVLASFTSDLSNVGTEVQTVHSKALVPELVNIIDKFEQSVQSTIRTTDYNEGNFIEPAFNKSTVFFYESLIARGIYFNVTLNDYWSNGYIRSTGALYSLDVSFTICNENTNITRDDTIMVSYG